jgi:hypothetical protein
MDTLDADRSAGAVVGAARTSVASMQMSRKRPVACGCMVVKGYGCVRIINNEDRDMKGGWRAGGSIDVCLYIESKKGMKGGKGISATLRRRSGSVYTFVIFPVCTERWSLPAINTSVHLARLRVGDTILKLGTLEH